ncbi:MAG: toxin-antitoxin (TA) system antitoxin [Candidatus Electrothrix sp. AX5]|uniref:Antitoxin component of toxin-antitoxin stability system, DNA-binding transcriptional repressor n=1 Tax=Candidatus Electrothrix aarhusensis TaxID=1859131 RepID=A0A444IXA3_9BACT|nr:toxin-antitoxin (TA) system antitoxin [Candidatus Electrothrix sp. AX5]RWX45412.1 Antitoxin component of toxin-antitoxin stability system, DNA-binding transcriptional repressor [Candidatus Electrothrix aarhusensis]
MLTKTVDIHSARISLEEVLAAVRKGAAIIFTEGSVPLARIIPLLPSKGGRIPELHSGAVETTDDFDEPLSDKFWLGEDA